MSNTNEKAVLRVNADGDVISCPKGNPTKCSWTPGDKVCGKCGAMAVMTKRDYGAETREEYAGRGMALPDGSFPIRDLGDLRNAIQAFGRAKDKAKAKAHIVKRARALGALDELPDGWMSGSKGMDRSRAAHHMGRPGAHDPDDADFGTGMEREMDEEVADEDQGVFRKPSARNMPPAETEDVMGEEDEPAGVEGNPEEMSEDTEDELQRQARIKKYRKMRLGGMGVKSATGDESVFLCAVERKMMPNGSQPCEGCAGGCFPVSGYPDLLAIEGMALAQFGGKVLDSGYSNRYDTFVVDVRRKDGRVVEAYYDGSGRSEGWHPLPEDAIAYADEIVSGDEAIITAINHVKGKALDLSVMVVKNEPAYRVEIDGSDGYSYDVFVGMDGKVLGVDQFEYEVKSGSDDLTASLMEFEALATEAELRDQGLI